MYNDLYKSEKTEVTATQILMAALIIVFAFVIPAGYIESRRNFQDNITPYTPAALAERTRENTDNGTNPPLTNQNEQQEGSVAGAATSSANYVRIPLTTTYVNMDSTSTLVVLAGVGLMGLSVGLIAYLAVGSKNNEEGYNLNKFEYQNLEKWS